MEGVFLVFDVTETGHAGNTFFADSVSLDFAFDMGCAEDLSKLGIKPFGFRLGRVAGGED